MGATAAVAADQRLPSAPVLLRQLDQTKTGQETVKELRVLAPGSDMGLRPVTAGRRLLLESGEVHAPAAEV